MEKSDTKRWLEYETGERTSDKSPEQAQEEWEIVGRVQMQIDERRDMGKYADHLEFYKVALKYKSGNRREYPLQKARTLAEFYPDFRHDGKTPLIDDVGDLSDNVLEKRYPESYIGKIFDDVVSGVEKDLNE